MQHTLSRTGQRILVVVPSTTIRTLQIIWTIPCGRLACRFSSEHFVTKIGRDSAFRLQMHNKKRANEFHVVSHQTLLCPLQHGSELSCSTYNLGTEPHGLKQLSGRYALPGAYCNCNTSPALRKPFHTILNKGLGLTPLCISTCN